MFAAARRRAFSLIELVIVIVIIGIIGAIAIPRMSRGAQGAADSALTANLSLLRNQLDMFKTEHGDTLPSLANLPNALTQYSDEAGTTFKPAKDLANGIYLGPYMRAIPPLPVGTNKGSTTFTGTLGTAGFGWVYDATAGTIQANCADAETDAKGKKYNAY
jgi:prepilin-type N-terminal cleavage/methylation domain-containing protein